MTTYELFEIICEHYNYDKKEIIANLNELLFSIHENSKKFEYELDKAKEEYALDGDNSVCPICGENLMVLDKWVEPHGEEFCQIGCGDDNCSYILNE